MIMKGQSSIEFFAYFSISMLVLALMYTAVLDRQTEVFEYREASSLESAAQKTGFELENAQINGEGYSKELDLPREINGQEYNLSTNENFVVAKTSTTNLTVSTRYAGREVSLKSEDAPFEVKNNGSIHIVSR